MALPDPTRDIDCWGDSQTQGYPNEFGEPVYQWWQWLRDYLRADGDSRLVHGRGAGGQNSSQIAARAGAVAISITIDGGVVPADGEPVGVSAIIPDFLTATSEQIFSVTIAGLPGTLIRGNDGACTFTRAVNGIPIDVPANVPLMLDIAPIRTQAIFVGRNDVAFEFDTLLNNIQAMERYHQPDCRPTLVMGPTNASAVNPSGAPSIYADEGRGTPAYVQLRLTVDRLSAEYGSRFLDVHRSLVDDGQKMAAWLDTNGHFSSFALSYRPHDQDIEDIAADRVPASLRGDGLHFNSFGHAVVGWLVRKRLMALDF